ncbi:ABC transporter, ATP-binding protein [Cooperia oncophora]
MWSWSEESSDKVDQFDQKLGFVAFTSDMQFLTGISPILFWTASFLYDFLFYSLVCTFCVVVVVINGWLKGYIGMMVLLFILYFWSCVPFVYAVSFMFTSPSKANVLLILWQLIAAFASMMIMYILNSTGLKEQTIIGAIRVILLCILPSFAFGDGVIAVGESSADEVPPSTMWEWNKLGISNKITRHICLQDREDALKVDEKDSAKAEERVSVDEFGDDMALEVKDLYKTYGDMRALNGLTMGVHNSECFGLLGANGAGKTTTFDILTGQSFATSGTARIDKRDVTERIILARMHGFPDPDEVTDVVLRNVGMEGHADKLVRYCSGGQRRKISVGLVLLAPVRFIILDEPTAGVDPKARREIWEVLSIIRDSSHSALLLTSHSMDEV